MKKTQTTQTEIEKLAAEKDQTWREYDKLRAPTDEAYKRHKAAAKAYAEALLYEKAKRQVMRDLINAAGVKEVTP